MSDDPVITSIRESYRESRTERDRVAAMEAVLNTAPDLGVDEAIARYGGALSPTERDLIGGLSPKELQNLKDVRGKLGSLGNLAKDNNNNNF